MSKTSVAPASAGSKIDQVVKTTIAIRDKRAELKRKYEELLEAEDAPLREKEDKLRDYLHNTLLDTGGDSISTASGTVYFSTNQKVTVQDWEALYDLIRTSGDLALLERRAAKGNVIQYMKDHGGEAPPGVQISTERTLNVRKK